MQPTFDYESTLRRMGDDVQLFREMVELVSEDGPRRLSEVQAGIRRRDRQRVRHAGHSLKGLAANFSAERLIAAAAVVEKLAHEERWGELEIAAGELDEALDELLASLRPFAAAAGYAV